MRVGLDGYPLTVPLTGIGHYTFELARSLAQAAPSFEFETVSPIPYTTSVIAELHENPVTNLRAIKTKSALNRRLWWFTGLPRYLKRSSIDVFHGTNYSIPVLGTGASVLSIHDLSLLLHADWHPKRLAWRARKRLPFMARVAKMIITPSEAVKREVCEHLKVGSEKVAVTPYAARPIFRPLPPNESVETRRRFGIEDDFILFVGTLEPRKNLLTLVRAFAEILRNTSLCPQLVIAGPEGWMMDGFRSLVAESGVRDRICFTGYLTDTDLCALYSSCRTFVYPSCYEGFGLPLLEAMSCGTPVITSRIPAIIETVGSAAHLVQPDDIGALARSIIMLLHDEELRRSLSSAGSRRAAEFSWARTASLTLDVYRKVMSQAR